MLQIIQEILAIAFVIRTQYLQFSDNHDTCQMLYDRVTLVSANIEQLKNAPNADSYKDSLEKLKITLQKVLQYIQKYGRSTSPLHKAGYL